MFTKDPQFWQAMRNTIWIICVGLPLEIAFALLTAMLLTRPRRGHRVYRTIYFLPTLAPPVAAALAFVFILNPAIGPVNQVLRGLGVAHPPLWFFDPSTSKWGLVFLGLWGVGQTMIIFLAGLLDVPRQLYEAADIEGATGVQKFRYVTLPMISPVIFFSLVDRRDLRVPVLHARPTSRASPSRARPRAPPRRTSGRRRARCSSTRSTST